MNNNNLYNNLQLQDKIILKAGSLDNIEQMIKNKLRRKIGNKCIKDGYVLSNTIHILKRSIGKINTAFFDGSISYNIQYSAKVCNPKEGSFIVVEYVDHNKMGILAKKSNTPLNIVIPKQLHKNKDLFKKIEEQLQQQQKIYLKIQVIGKRFEKDDTEIFVIGKLINIQE